MTTKRMKEGRMEMIQMKMKEGRMERIQMRMKEDIDEEDSDK